jgi:hypothetical protein
MPKARDHYQILADDLCTIMTPLRGLLAGIFLQLALQMHGQGVLEGGVDYPQLGISFTVPEGWQANEGDGMIFIGSKTTAGLILMSVHEFGDLEDMRLSVGSGFSEDGMELFAAGEIRMVKNDVVVVDYTGKIEDQPARGLGAARLNPLGNSVSVIALALERTWSDALPAAAMELMESITFRPVPRTGPTPEQWKRHLMNVRLTRIEDQPEPPAEEGTITNKPPATLRQQIDLCNGRFNQISTRSNDEQAGNAGGQTRSRGTWDVMEGSRGTILRLDHEDGRRSEYELDEQEGRTYLNGRRWFRTWEGEHAPECDR